MQYLKIEVSEHTIYEWHGKFLTFNSLAFQDAFSKFTTKDEDAKLFFLHCRARLRSR
jgi:hypothetical protein